VLKSLSRTETGIYTYPTLLYFLEQEYYRYETSGLPFSILILEAKVHPANDATLIPLPLLAVKEMVKRIKSIKRNLDILAHYQTLDFAMLLPITNNAAASIMANRIAEVLLSSPLTADLHSHKLELSIGIASMPEDCRELGMVLSAAWEAKNQSKELNKPVLLFRDLQRSK
jgi:diguanylate cyclase (GGDEF)-like protein